MLFNDGVNNYGLYFWFLFCENKFGVWGLGFGVWGLGFGVWKIIIKSGN
jgi:hypothetical protein